MWTRAAIRMWGAGGMATAKAVAVRGFASTSHAAAAASIGFIGVGNMGSHMAKNLLKAGNALKVYDVVPENVERVVSAGGEAAASPAAAATDVDVVVTMLPSSPHVLECYGGDNGVLAGVQPGALLIDSSTIDVGTSRKVNKQAAAAGVAMVDAPVSGGVPGAEAGTLTFMVGGADADFARAEPILAHMGAKIVHCGGAGNGQVAKICNNLALAIQMGSMCEAYNLGITLGMDAERLASIFNTSTSRCWSADSYNPVPGVMEGVPSSRDYAGGFACDLMLKDLGLAVEAAESVGAKIRLGDEVRAMYADMSAQGKGRLDFSGLYTMVQAWSEGQGQK